MDNNNMKNERGSQMDMIADPTAERIAEFMRDAVPDANVTVERHESESTEFQRLTIRAELLGLTFAMFEQTRETFADHDYEFPAIYCCRPEVIGMEKAGTFALITFLRRFGDVVVWSAAYNGKQGVVDRVVPKFGSPDDEKTDTTGTDVVEWSVGGFDENGREFGGVFAPNDLTGAREYMRHIVASRTVETATLYRQYGDAPEDCVEVETIEFDDVAPSVGVSNR